MKLITLNVWGGRINKPLMEFFCKHSDVDIFCLQEVYSNASRKIATDDMPVDLNLFQHIQECLPQHRGFFRPVVENLYGICTFVKNSTQVIDEDDAIVHDNPHYTGNGPLHPRNLQWLECVNNNCDYTVFNLHGLWNGQGKTDTDDRKRQSQLIKNYVDQVTMPKILCGDFNLRPDTESLAIAASDMRNLVAEYGVTSTRTSLYTKAERFADYIFVSNTIDVCNFAVLEDEVSDHSPLLLEFDVLPNLG